MTRTSEGSFGLKCRLAGRIRSRARWSLNVQRLNRHRRFSYREMQRTTVGGCRQAGGSLEQGGTVSLQLVAG